MFRPLIQAEASDCLRLRPPWSTEYVLNQLRHQEDPASKKTKQECAREVEQALDPVQVMYVLVKGRHMNYYVKRASVYRTSDHAVVNSLPKAVFASM